MLPSARGSVLVLVLSTLLVVELIVGGIFALVFSNLHGQVAAGLAMESASVAEAGLHYAVAQLVARASGAQPTDEAYAGDAADVPLTDATGTVRGIFHASVSCARTPDASPPHCGTSLSPADESDWRRITSEGFVPSRPGRARRVIEATIRRFRPQGNDTPLFGVCGRDGVDLDGAVVTADVGSNGDIRVGRSGAIKRRTPVAPTASGTVQRLTARLPAPGLTGAYSWRVTFLDYRGQESSGSPPTTPLRLDREYARLTAVPVGPTSATKRRIYRTRAEAASTGPWYLVGEIPDNTTREYADTESDETLRVRIQGPIAGNAVAAGAVTCVEDCRAQVDGTAQAHVRGVNCPLFLAPPCEPGGAHAPPLIVQDRRDQEMHWGPLHATAGKIVSIVTPNDAGARLHIHVTDIDMARDSALIVFGQGTVYLHVQGPIHLGERAMLGVGGGYPVGALIRPSDRVQILGCAQDPPSSASDTHTPSVRFDQGNRVSVLLFAPNAAISIGGPAAFSGTVFGRYVRLTGPPADATPSNIAGFRPFASFRSDQGGSVATYSGFGRVTAATRIVLDPSEALGSASSGARPSAFQYLVRWNDLPYPGPSRPPIP